jgi:hypothetical protein
MLDDGHGKRGLAHGRPTGDHNQIGVLEAGSLGIENLEAGKSVPGCDEEERAPFYLSNQEEIYNDLPYVFLYVGLSNGVWWDRLNNHDPNVWNRWYNIHEWYLTE